MFRTLAITTSLLVSSALAWQSPYADCQLPRPQGQQLSLCPNGTLYVSQTDPQAGYGSISSAIAALPNDSSNHTILVGPGSYHEILNITRKGPLTLLGITHDPADYTANLVHVWNSSYINQTSQTSSQDNADAVVLTVSPNRAASLVGSGPLGAPLQPEFGCSDFKMYNIDVANRATINGVEHKTSDTGPSAALFVAYANASFYGCTFASYQDTLYVGRNGSAVFFGGEVRGSTDYIYGFGTAYFEGTTLASRGIGGGITAWKGSTQWYGPNTFGVYFRDSKIVAAPDPIPNVTLTHNCALGRPWNNQSRVVYMDTEMSDIVNPQGFIIWSASDPRVFPNVTFFIESGSHGPGWNPSSRNYSIESTIPASQAKAQYSLSDVFGGFPSWVDSAYVYN